AAAAPPVTRAHDSAATPATLAAETRRRDGRVFAHGQCRHPSRSLRLEAPVEGELGVHALPLIEDDRLLVAAAPDAHQADGGDARRRPARPARLSGLARLRLGRRL